MGKLLPEEVMLFTKDNWSRLGMTPIFLWRLIEDRGYTYEEIDTALKDLIGEDYLDIGATEWIDRIIAKGNKEMAHSEEFDEPPVIDVLDHAIGEFLNEKE